MARASRLAKDLRIPRDLEVGRSKQGEQSPSRRTDLRNDPSTLVSGKSSPFAGGRWNEGLGQLRQVQREAPTSPSFGSGRHRVLGISGGGEHAIFVHRSTDDGTRVLRSRITGPCCSALQDGELPSFPSKPDHRPCSRHRKVRHVAREGRCGEERQTAWLFGSRWRRKSTFAGNVDRGDSLARKRIDGSQACPRVGIVLQRSVNEIAAQRSASPAPYGDPVVDVVRCAGGS